MFFQYYICKFPLFSTLVYDQSFYIIFKSIFIYLLLSLFVFVFFSEMNKYSVTLYLM